MLIDFYATPNLHSLHWKILLLFNNIISFIIILYLVQLYINSFWSNSGLHRTFPFILRYYLPLTIPPVPTKKQLPPLESNIKLVSHNCTPSPYVFLLEGNCCHAMQRLLSIRLAWALYLWYHMSHTPHIFVKHITGEIMKLLTSLHTYLIHQVIGIVRLTKKYFSLQPTLSFTTGGLLESLPAFQQANYKNNFRVKDTVISNWLVETTFS